MIMSRPPLPPSAATERCAFPGCTTAAQSLSKACNAGRLSVHLECSKSLIYNNGTGTQGGGLNFMKCGRCRLVAYCSTEVRLSSHTNTHTNTHTHTHTSLDLRVSLSSPSLPGPPSLNGLIQQHQKLDWSKHKKMCGANAPKLTAVICIMPRGMIQIRAMPCGVLCT